MATSFTITLSEKEIALLRSALDSFSYWEHKDDLPHGSGYIYDPDMLDPNDYDIEEIKSSEAWQEVKAAEELDTRLAELGKLTESEQRLLDGNR